MKNLEKLCSVLSTHASGFPENISELKTYEEQLTEVVLQLSKYARLTWRNLINYLDLAEETDAADAIKNYAEPLNGM